MSILLDLPLNLEDELSAEASQLDLPLPEYILQVLSVRPAIGHPPQTGAELVAYWQAEGVIKSRWSTTDRRSSDITDSQTHARNLRHEAETRNRG
jgi:hypothetical protein